MIGRVLAQLRALLGVQRDNPVLLRAQHVALSRQMPVMYVILLINSVALAVTHFHLAPDWLALYLPAVLTGLGSYRAWHWWRKRGVPATPAAILHTLTRTNRLAVFIAFAFTAWALALYPYGDAYARSHIAFYMAITVIACIFCMMHLRSAALITTAVVNLAFVGFFLSTGTYVYMAMAANVLLVSAGMIWVLHDHYQDFTRLVNLQAHTEKLREENERLANQDSLTGLPNRRQFFALLEANLAAASNDQSRLAVGLIDLDGFKPVNDLYGHSVGDKLLFQVGQRLARYENSDLHLARLGGDEFGLLKRDASEEGMAALGRDIRALLEEPFTIGEIQVSISASLGLVVYPDMAADATQAYEFADYALYQSKRQGAGSICVFSASHYLELSRDIRTEQGLRNANVLEEFSVAYQPILDIRSGKTVGFEALARWSSPQLGPVAPGQFIPVAERLGLINRLTLPLLGKALAGALMWPEDVRLAFNLSAHDCGSMEVVNAIVGFIKDSGVNPARLDFEITETAVIQDIEQAQRAVAIFRTLGCGISLDDFGTGYSSLSQLHGLALTKLKIDRSFVMGIHRNPASYKIVKSLLALSADMGLDCISEGLETVQELEVLKSLGCVLAQGYLIAKPMSAEQSVLWLQGKRETLIADASNS
ncbi:putative bifunctional diguanylate cyclase/phosphodiesterase [Pseudomonas sp. NPDC090208]|uniref:putative bifunctional diguanylate cyclase/phosphodiesterase n=1 Tax=Pseudomonas sp. NPDC090208 TaxID=3364478 RepID=UPI00382120F5